jgi:putative heme transporter
MLAASLVAVIALLYVALPTVAGLDKTWTRLASGDPIWLFAALLLELLSFASYVVFFRAVFAGPPAWIDWLVSYRITMAGVVATRLLAVAGAGGIALTAWALQRIGLAVRELTVRMAAFYVLLYGVYMGALLIGGIGLYAGIFAGAAPPGLTVAPAIFGAIVIAAALLVAALSDDLDRVLDAPARAEGSGRLGKVAAAIPATISSGVHGAIILLRAPRPALLGAVGWFAFDIGVLWASLEAFGTAPPAAVVVMAYFVGMLANTLPIPGGIGAVDGGMIGALIGFGVADGLAIVAVLSYRAFAFWLPIGPGVIAYLQLLRSPRRRLVTPVRSDRGTGSGGR